MMRQILTLLLSCLLLVCCEKPSSSDQRTADSASVRRKTRDQNRRQVPKTEWETPATLRNKYGDAAGIESPAERGRAIAALAWNALELDPELASEAFLQLPEDSPERIRLIQHYAMRIAEHNREKAIAWANTLRSDLESSSALSQIALTLAETDPRGSANLLSESGIAGRDFDVAVVQVIQRWAAKSPPEASAWVVAFQPGPARESGIKHIAAQWLQADARAAISWLVMLEDAAVRKEVALGLEEAILQQPEGTRNAWWQHADAGIRNELEQQREKALENIGDNVLQPLSLN